MDIEPAGRRKPVRRPVAALGAFGVVGAAALVFASLRPRRVVVHGSSMAPALRPGDRLLVVRRSEVAVGDVIALHDPRDRTQMLVKRVGSVGADTVTVLGDNAAASTDSRVFGPVPRRDVIGTVVRRYRPTGRQGPVGPAGATGPAGRPILAAA